MTPRRNARRLARELKHAPPVFDLDDESPWPLPEPVCSVACRQGANPENCTCRAHGWTHQEEPCKRPTTK